MQEAPIPGRTGGPAGRLVGLVAPLVVAVPVSTLAAQEGTPATPVPSGAPEVRPAGERVTTGRWTYEMQVKTDGGGRRLGTYRLSVKSVPGSPARRRWRVVQRTELAAGRSTIVDSVWLAPESLRPLRRVSRSPRGRLELHYGPGEVRGERRSPDGTFEPTEARLPPGTYSASVVDVLVQALPLEEGLQVKLPLYDDTRGVVTGRARVAGSETVELADGERVEAWILSVRVGRRAATSWIHKRTGVGIRTEAELPTGDVVVQELVDAAGLEPER